MELIVRSTFTSRASGTKSSEIQKNQGGSKQSGAPVIGSRHSVLRRDTEKSRRLQFFTFSPKIGNKSYLYSDFKKFRSPKMQRIKIALIITAFVIGSCSLFSDEPASLVGKWKFNVKESDNPRDKFQKARGDDSGDAHSGHQHSGGWHHG